MTNDPQKPTSFIANIRTIGMFLCSCVKINKCKENMHWHLCWWKVVHHCYIQGLLWTFFDVYAHIILGDFCYDMTKAFVLILQTITHCVFIYPQDKMWLVSEQQCSVQNMMPIDSHYMYANMNKILQLNSL